MQDLHKIPTKRKKTSTQPKHIQSRWGLCEVHAVSLMLTAKRVNTHKDLPKLHRLWKNNVKVKDLRILINKEKNIWSFKQKKT